jgi:hypothetical protein
MYRKVIVPGLEGRVKKWERKMKKEMVREELIEL